MAIEKWSCDSKAIYQYYQQKNYRSINLDAGVVFWVRCDYE